MPRKPVKLMRRKPGVVRRHAVSTDAVEPIPVKPVVPVQPAPSKPAPEVKQAHKRTVIENPNIGYLTPEEFEEIGKAVLGGRGWQRTLMAGTGWAQSTVTRYLRGIIPVPRDVALLMSLLQTLRNNDLPIPGEFFQKD